MSQDKNKLDVALMVCMMRKSNWLFFATYSGGSEIVSQSTLKNESSNIDSLTSGSVAKSILRFAPPFFLSYFLQTLYGMADLFIIGQYCGVTETTAVSIGSQAMHMLTVMIVGLSMGSTIKIGKAVGSRNHEEASKAIGNTVSLFILLSVVLTGVLLLLVSPITSVLKTPIEAVQETKNYLTICFIGVPAITAYNILSAIFRGLGDSRKPMYFIAVACVANIGMDYLFIGSMNMGSAGAALGTVCGQLISVIIAVVFVSRANTGIILKARDLFPQKKITKEIFGVGMPIAIQDGFIQISFIVITVIVNMRGLNDAAAVGIVEKFISFLFLVPSSMLATVSALGALNIGAGQHDRVKSILKHCIICCVSFGILISVLMQFQAEIVVSLFSMDATVIYMGAQYMHGYVLDCIFAGIHFCFSGYFCAYGKSVYSFVHNVCSIVLARIPLAYFASKMFADTLLPMGLATATGSVVSVGLCFLFYTRMQAAADREETSG